MTAQGLCGFFAALKMTCDHLREIDDTNETNYYEATHKSLQRISFGNVDICFFQHVPPHSDVVCAVISNANWNTVQFDMTKYFASTICTLFVFIIYLMNKICEKICSPLVPREFVLCKNI